MTVASLRPTRSTVAPACGSGLSTAALMGLVDDIVAARTLWSRHVAHDAEERTTVRLIGSDLYEVWLLGWAPGQGVELHDHGPSDAAFGVVEGELVELEPARGRLERRVLRAGDRRCVPSGTVHDVLNASPAPATSIHAYSPPLSGMTFYDSIDIRPVRFEPVQRVAAVLDGPFGALPVATAAVAGGIPTR